MNEMIEKVTRALMDEIKRQVDGHPIEGVPASIDSWTATGGTLGLVDLARAAIEAMREPTGAISHINGSVNWPEMIDAALKNDTPPKQ